MATFQFELVSPEKIVFSDEVDQVDVPGTEGDFGVLAGHAPLISLLRPGVVTVWSGKEEVGIAVRGGIAEVAPNRLVVLVDYAVPVADIDRVALDQAIRDAQEDLTDARDDAERSRAAQRLEQLSLLKRTSSPKQ